MNVNAASKTSKRAVIQILHLTFQASQNTPQKNKSTCCSCHPPSPCTRVHAATTSAKVTTSPSNTQSPPVPQLKWGGVAGVTECDVRESDTRDGDFLKTWAGPAASEVNNEQVDCGLSEKLQLE